MTYPAILNDCEACHVPGSYDFSTSANAAAMPNLLWTTVATGKTLATAYSIKTDAETVLSTDSVISPFIDPNTSNHVNPILALADATGYGAGYATNLATTSVTPATDAAAATLVCSPITSACPACRDSKVAIAHMEGNGGSFYDSRTVSVLAGKIEQCMICHDNGKTADIRAVPMTWK